MIKKLLLASGLLVSMGVITGIVSAVSNPEWVTRSTLPISTFIGYVEVPPSSSSIPRVVELTGMDFTSYLDRGYLIVGSNSTSTSVLGHLKSVSSFTPEKIIATGHINGEYYKEMTDGKIDNFNFFPINQSKSSTEIDFISPQPIVSDTITIALDKYVTAPDRVSLAAIIDDQLVFVIADKPLSDLTFHFPEMKANRWKLMLTYSQPLRISEVTFNQKDVNQRKSTSLLFLRQPNTPYRVYFRPETPLSVVDDYSISSVTDTDKINYAYNDWLQNRDYVLGDQDGDSITDRVDNCSAISNADQADIDYDGRGDVCDDDDYDGVMNVVDNCPKIPNPDQEDTDADNVGNACDNNENRITEKYPWLPWIGIGSAALVLIVLFGVTARGIPSIPKKETESSK